MEYLVKKVNVNYLDDYLFISVMRIWCNEQVKIFNMVCSKVGMPVSPEKTFWASQKLTFLGLLIDAKNQVIGIPIDKINKVMDILIQVLNRKSRKIKLKELQQICGHLNFMC